MDGFKEARMHPQEEERMRDLLCLGIIPEEREIKLDLITELTKEVFQVSISIITLIDKDKQFCKSFCGMDVKHTQRNISICGHAILSNKEVFIIEDTFRDERFRNNPLDPWRAFPEFCVNSHS